MTRPTARRALEGGSASGGAGDEPLLAALDEVIERYGGPPYGDEIVRARVEFTDRTGRFFEEDELFEARTAAFLEWYAVERRLGGGVPADAVGRTPVRAALAGLGPDDARRRALRAWATSHRSLFLLAALPGRDAPVHLLDLLGGGRFDVRARAPFDGVAAGDIVEARLLGWEGQVHFGRTFLFHPAEARAALVAHGARIRARGGSRVEAVDFAAHLRMKAERYRHVAAARVYQGKDGPP